MSNDDNNPLNHEFIDFILRELDLYGLQKVLPEARVNSLFAKLYNERGLYIERVSDSGLKHKTAEKVGSCPYCQSSIEESEARVVCKNCGIPHHEECWKENGSCAVFGCGHEVSLSNNTDWVSEQPRIVLNKEDIKEEPKVDKKVKDGEPDESWKIAIYVSLALVLLSLIIHASGC